jgi:small multidrug resistance pump
MPKPYLFLIVAVLFETFGTTCLQASQQFTRLLPSIGVALGFAGSFYMLTLTLKYMPLGIVYAFWSGLGIILITAIGVVVFRQSVDLAAVIGMALIIAGILVIHLFSNTAPH